MSVIVFLSKTYIVVSNNVEVTRTYKKIKEQIYM
jgi:hypothetical protein